MEILIVVLIALALVLWTAPTHTAVTARVPGDKPLPEGFQLKLVSNTLPTACYFEVAVKPPGLQVGAIDQTTMYNSNVRTKLPAKLKEWMAITGTAAWGPKVFSAADVRDALMGRNSSWTCYFPDGSYLDFWGWLDQFDPQETQDKNRPIANITVEISNLDTAGNIVEPVYFDVSGT